MQEVNIITEMLQQDELNATDGKKLKFLIV